MTESGNPSTQLLSVELTGVPESANYRQCQYKGRDTENTLCAISPTTEVKNTCSGDSGGPLVWQNPALTTDADGGWRLVGLTSWGDTKCQSYGVYTALAAYPTWIAKAKAGEISPHQTASLEESVEVSSGYAGGLAFLILMGQWCLRRIYQKRKRV